MTEPFELRPRVTEDIGQNIVDFHAEMQRLRDEHGPFLRELHCDSVVLRYLALRLPPVERKPWEPQPLGIPVIPDDDVPARHIRRVYDDGTSEDVEVMSEALYEINRDLPKMLEFKVPPSDSVAAYYRSKTVYTAPPLGSIIGPIGG
jgi:hypothetical protein